MIANLDPHEWAQLKSVEAFEEARKCHMAHTVLAVENLISSRHGGKPFAIQIKQTNRVQGRSLLYLFHVRNTAQIWVRDDIGLEQQRLAIAHELGHLLAAYEHLGSGHGLPPRASVEDETACKEFEKWLCARLHYLYTRTDYPKSSLFQSLDTFCEDNKDYFLNHVK